MCTANSSSPIDAESLRTMAESNARRNFLDSMPPPVDAMGMTANQRAVQAALTLQAVTESNARREFRVVFPVATMPPPGQPIDWQPSWPRLSEILAEMVASRTVHPATGEDVATGEVTPNAESSITSSVESPLDPWDLLAGDPPPPASAESSPWPEDSVAGDTTPPRSTAATAEPRTPRTPFNTPLGPWDDDSATGDAPIIPPQDDSATGVALITPPLDFWEWFEEDSAATGENASLFGGPTASFFGKLPLATLKNEAWQAMAYALLNYPDSGERIGNFMQGRFAPPFASTTDAARGCLMAWQLQQMLATAIATGASETTSVGVGRHGRRKHRHRRLFPPAVSYARAALKSMKVMHGTKKIPCTIKIIRDKKGIIKSIRMNMIVGATK